MKTTFKTLLSLLGLAMILNACDGQADTLINERLEENPLPEAPEYRTGDADFSTFIAIGNSLTAGYMDGALFDQGQQNSLAAMMAAQFSAATEGGITFNQPDINSPAGFNTVVSNPSNGTVLGRFKLDTSIPGPSPTINGDPITPYNGPQVHNFGVPGIQVGQLLTPATGGPASPANPAFNPFYQRFASNPSQDGATGSTILGDAVATNPTFFSLWIGNNDILGYASTGASNEAILTSDNNFDTFYTGVINTLMSTSADGIAADIPFILGLPLFRAVPVNAIVLDEATANQLNGAFEAVNDAIQALVDNLGHPQADADARFVSYSAGPNPILIYDESLEDLGPKFDMLQGAGAITAQERASLEPYRQSRPIQSSVAMLQGDSELVTLAASTVLGTLADPANPFSQIGIVLPLADQYTITASEYRAIETKRQTFNRMIADAVAQYPNRIAFYNTNSPSGAFLDIFGLSDGQPGITVNGVNLAPDFSPNGVLSTDGVHPNLRGYAIIANEMLEVIEAKFGANLPSVNVLNLPGVIVCGVGDCVSEQGS